MGSNPIARSKFSPMISCAYGPFGLAASVEYPASGCRFGCHFRVAVGGFRRTLANELARFGDQAGLGAAHGGGRKWRKTAGLRAAAAIAIPSFMEFVLLGLKRCHSRSVRWGAGGRRGLLRGFKSAFGRLGHRLDMPTCYRLAGSAGDAIGLIVGRASIGPSGIPRPGPVLDAGYHVNLGNALAGWELAGRVQAESAVDAGERARVERQSGTL